MKACPVCGRLYPPDAGFCPIEGSELTSATQAPIPSTDQDPRVGQVMFLRYQIRRVVADGGMGRVYEALDMQDKRSVAMKLLHPDVAKDEVSVERFKREFEISSKLPHDHIVEVLDFQPTTDGTYALVMEFLYGEELRNTLKREKVLPSARIVRMLSQIAVGLDKAHAIKYVHRDLKPDNIFLCQTSEGDIVKLLDFGSVKDKSEGGKKLTVLGTTIGSPFYMAPEQAQGLDTLDHRADVWAVAAIMYECMVGEVPFKGINGPSILLEILTKEPQPPSEAAKGQKYPVPPTLDRVLAAAFKKNASMRIGSLGQLADSVGEAYGLTGGHQVWATTKEADLEQQIAEKIDSLMTAAPVQAAPTDAVADGFFGDDDSLGMDMPGASPPQAPPPQAGQPVNPNYGMQPTGGYGGGQDAPLVVPKTSIGWVMPVLVGGIALVVGVVIVLVVMS